MKNTLIVVGTLMAAILSALAQEKAKAQKEAKPGTIVVHARTPAAKPAAVTEPAPPKQQQQPWAAYTVTISPSEQHVIRAYVHHCRESSKGRKPTALPAGLAKATEWGFGTTLPTGWEKKCVRGEVLSKEVHERCHPLPNEVIVKLPPPPPGTVLLAVEGKVLRLAYPTYEILDVFDVL